MSNDNVYQIDEKLKEKFNGVYYETCDRVTNALSQVVGDHGGIGVAVTLMVAGEVFIRVIEAVEKFLPEDDILPWFLDEVANRLADIGVKTTFTIENTGGV